MVLDAALFNTQHYKVRIKDKVEQSRKWSSAPLHLGVVAIEKGAFGSPSTKGDNFTLLTFGAMTTRIHIHNAFILNEYELNLKLPAIQHELGEQILFVRLILTECTSLLR